MNVNLRQCVCVCVVCIVGHRHCGGVWLRRSRLQMPVVQTMLQHMHTDNMLAFHTHRRCRKDNHMVSAVNHSCAWFGCLYELCVQCKARFNWASGQKVGKWNQTDGGRCFRSSTWEGCSVEGNTCRAPQMARHRALTLVAVTVTVLLRAWNVEPAWTMTAVVWHWVRTVVCCRSSGAGTRLRRSAVPHHVFRYTGLGHRVKHRAVVSNHRGDAQYLHYSTSDVRQEDGLKNWDRNAVYTTRHRFLKRPDWFFFFFLSLAILS